MTGFCCLGDNLGPSLVREYPSLSLDSSAHLDGIEWWIFRLSLVTACKLCGALILCVESTLPHSILYY